MVHTADLYVHAELIITAPSMMAAPLNVMSVVLNINSLYTMLTCRA